MWSKLPADLLAPIERARASAEARFLEAIDRVKDRGWRECQALVLETMTSTFRAFSKQATRAVDEQHWTVGVATLRAAEFLDEQAQTIHVWLVRATFGNRWLGGPFSFRRYESEDRFVFSRDIVEKIQRAEPWRAFLKTIARQPKRAAPILRAEGRERASRIAAFKERVFAESSKRLSNEKIWRVAGYTQKKEFYEFQRGQGSPGASAKFERILGMTPEAFLTRVSRLPKI
jgi:hypothetical protein